MTPGGNRYNSRMHLLCLSNDPALQTALTEALAPLGDAVVSLEMANPKTLTDSQLAAADGVLCGHLTPEQRAKMPRLRWIQFWSAGVDDKLFPGIFEGGVTVCTGSGIHAESGANHVLAMLLAFARGMPQAYRQQAQRRWDRASVVSEQFELEGKTAGILGTGAIGQSIGRRCQALGMRTLGVRRHADRPAPGFDLLLPHLQYHEMILESNFLILALPLTPSTRWIFGEDEVEIVRKGTYLFNVGRGGLVDERYVFTALKNRWLAGAGLDVFEEEPLPPDSPWWELDNVIITPHAGGNTPEYWPRLGRLVAEQVERHRRGEPFANRVDPELGY